MQHLPPGSIQSREEPCRWGVGEALSYSCAHSLLCISESRPLVSLGEARICYFVTEAKRKREHRGPSDAQTYDLAVLKMSELNASVSRCNLPGSRLGELSVFCRDYHEENGPIEKKGRGLPLPGPWESWERK